MRPSTFVLNSGTMDSVMNDFWKAVDGKISIVEFRKRMS